MEKLISLKKHRPKKVNWDAGDVYLNKRNG